MLTAMVDQYAPALTTCHVFCLGPLLLTKYSVSFFIKTEASGIIANDSFLLQHTYISMR
jgi:hypothetical protein